MKRDFYLLIDSSILCCYAVSKWIEIFSDNPHFLGVLVREDKPSDDVLKQREDFHSQYAGQTLLTTEITNTLFDLYKGMDSEAERAMINMFGLPRHSVSSAANTIFLGKNINGKHARQWMTDNYSDSRPFIFSHLGQIVKSWWLDLTGGDRLLNVHSAVLPYARGVYSIENMAATQDENLFRKAAGFTIHFIDKGVDTGPVIRTERLIDPFRFNSIWELKAYTYMVGYHVYADVAKHIIFNIDTTSVGTRGDPSLQGDNFRANQMNEAQKHLAEEGYLAMKQK